MQSKLFHMLSCRNRPASLDTEWTSAILGFHQEDLNILVKAKFLERQGNTKKGKMFFHRSDVEKLAEDRETLNNARILVEKKNAKKTKAKKKRVAAKKAAKKAMRPSNVVPMKPEPEGEDAA